MTELVEFLRARFDEDERAAQEAFSGQADPENGWGTERTEGYRHTAITPHVGMIHEAVQAAHIARHDPARVLREVEAKRRIIDEHVEMGIEGECARCVVWDEDQEGDLCADPCGYPCRTLRLLALPLADHPAYQHEWRP